MKKIDWILAPQITSPIRESSDIKKAIDLAINSEFDSFFFFKYCRGFIFFGNMKTKNFAV